MLAVKRQSLLLWHDFSPDLVTCSLETVNSPYRLSFSRHCPSCCRQAEALPFVLFKENYRNRDPGVSHFGHPRWE